ncbi:AAA family ATPase [Candidatus Bathyarchaeota archaeon]|nr:AAA family ATPase [Candidatus Bathyarchaeota archaeon]
MKIEIVQLENIRSHTKSTVPFVKGFNCLVGGLGCGKSSILYAIDFAFFGEPIGRSFEYLLREGASNGKVMVQFIQNGKNYKISRGLKRRGKGISQDIDELKLFEDENLIASVKSDAVAEQLKIITGWDRELFREIVWVRQEHLKELLDIAPRERQKRLDELFGLSDYEEAWSNIVGYQREYEGEKKAYEKDPDVLGMEKLATEYNRITEEFSLLEIDLQEMVKRLATAKKALEEADSKLKKLEEIKASIEELKRKEAQMQANLTNTEDTAAKLAEKLEAKKSLIENMRQRIGTMETQLTSYRDKLKEMEIPAEQPIETIRQYLAIYDDQIANLKVEQEATLRDMQTNQKRITSLSTENICPLCLQPLNDQYKNSLMQRIQEENNERQKTIGQLQREIEELQRTKNGANAAFSNMQMLTPKIEDLKLRVNEEETALTELSNEFERQQKLEGEIRKQLETVRMEISRFDISELEVAKTRKEEASRQYYTLEFDLRAKESHKKDLITRVEEVKDRIDVAEQKLERKEKIEKAVKIITSIRDAYRSIQPKLRSEFVKVLRNFVQQVLDHLTGGEGAFLNILIDETYSPYVMSEGGVEREVSNLSGGERTLLAFAYRLGLGQLIMQSRTGHGLSMLLLDEPTESLGREDGSIDRLAEAISRFKAIEQIIAVTHSEAFAEKAEHVIRLEKEAGESKVSVEKQP